MSIAMTNGKLTVEVITSFERRRRWTKEENPRAGAPNLRTWSDGIHGVAFGSTSGNSEFSSPKLRTSRFLSLRRHAQR